jgi:hypothetical protein
LSIQHNTLRDGYYGMYIRNSIADNDGLTIHGNTISRVSTGVVVALSAAKNYSNVTVDGNTITDLYYWDGCWGDCIHSNDWHHGNGVHFWGNYPGNTIGPVTMSNNYIYGQIGAHNTGLIVFEDTCTPLTIHGNVLTSSDYKPSDGYLKIESHTDVTAGIYNNTIIGRGTASLTGGTGIIFSGVGTTTATQQNNIISSAALGTWNSVGTLTLTSDHNILYDLTKAGQVASTSKTLAQWQALGYDADAITTDPLLDAAYGLQRTSPARCLGVSIAGITTDRGGVLPNDCGCASGRVHAGSESYCKGEWSW